MASRVSPSVPSWEKSGNVTWVACPTCKGWLPVDPKLVASDTIKMVCPRCTAEFGSEEAAQIVEA